MAKEILVASPSINAEVFPRPDRGRFAAMGSQAWTLIRRNPLGFAGLLIILTFAFIAVFGPAFARMV